MVLSWLLILLIVKIIEKFERYKLEKSKNKNIISFKIQNMH